MLWTVRVRLLLLLLSQACAEEVVPVPDELLRQHTAARRRVPAVRPGLHRADPEGACVVIGPLDLSHCGQRWPIISWPDLTKM